METADKKLSAKQRSANVAPEPEEGGVQDKFLLWQDENVDNGRVVKEHFDSAAEAFTQGVDCELAPFSSVLFKITVK